MAGPQTLGRCSFCDALLGVDDPMTSAEGAGPTSNIGSRCPYCGAQLQHAADSQAAGTGVVAVSGPSLLAQTIDTISEGILSFDTSGRIVFANSAAKRMLGLRDDELYGLNFDDPMLKLTPLSDEPVAGEQSPVARVLCAGSPVRGLEYQLDHSDSNHIVVLLNATPLRDRSGNVAGVGVTLQDISALRETESALLASETTLEGILNSGGQSVMVIGRDRQLQRVNTIASQRANVVFGTGIRPGDSIYKFVNPEDVDSFNAHFDAALTGETIRTERCLRGHDGKSNWFEIQYNPVYDTNGDVSAICMTAWPINDRKWAEIRHQFMAEASVALASSLDYQTTLATVARLAIPDLADHCMVSIVADDGSVARLAIAHVDPEKEALAQETEQRFPLRTQRGYGVAEVLETRRSNFIPFFDQELLLQASQSEEHREMLRRIGYRSYICVPMIARERVLGTISLFRTESWNQFTEQDLELAEELGRRAAIAIDNARLYREMKTSVQLREEFLSIASHELKTPLTTVKGYVQLLERHLQHGSDDPERAAVTMGQLQAQVKRFEELVNELLDLSRIQSGRLDLRLEWCDLVSVARQVFDRFQSVSERSAFHDLRFDAPEPVYGAWDASRIDQVLTNLLSNALKYSPHGGAVMLRVAREDGHAEIEVHDQGVGIPVSDQEILFRPFSRGVYASGIASGVGLGLHITAQIIERHGGTIDVRSEPGKGSVFTVRLPLEPPA